ncbi:MAG TPA: hypothetical protein DDY98_00685 [Ruminococcaceae bacterium]|nr:hypothetical protein [Oscillospiraceae bacterium]
MKKQKDRKEVKRAAIVFISLLLAFGVIPLRMMTILLSASQKTALGMGNGKVMTVGESRGIIYDCNMERLIGCDSTKIAAVKPTAGALAELKNRLNNEDFLKADEVLAKGEPMLLKTNQSLNQADILTLNTYDRSSADSLAHHIIGYTDESGNGVCGLEKSFNDLLNSYQGSLKVRFRCDATGKILQGEPIETIDNGYDNSGGIVLTLNKSFQQALENSMDICALKTGAAVILDCSDGAICAMVSRPDYDPTNVAKSLKQANSPLFNRALGAYPVGSVFKLLIAAAAMEQGIDPAKEWTCSGSIHVGGSDFGCLKVHGKVNMPQALAYSCNCYFIHLMEQLDCESVLECAESFGFGKSLQLADGLESAGGVLPSQTMLSAPAARANFSFGQGQLTASVLQIASLYATVLSYGEYHVPYLIKGQVDETGKFTSLHSYQPPFKLLRKENAQMLSDFLGVAVREGTGKAAQVDGADCKGKTATAQSGDFSTGKERLVSWFAGGFTWKSKQYAMVVLCDDGVSGSVDCAPVFAATVRRILAWS